MIGRGRGRGRGARLSSHASRVARYVLIHAHLRNRDPPLPSARRVAAPYTLFTPSPVQSRACNCDNRCLAYVGPVVSVSVDDDNSEFRGNLRVLVSSYARETRTSLRASLRVPRTGAYCHGSRDPSRSVAVLGLVYTNRSDR